MLQMAPHHAMLSRPTDTPLLEMKILEMKRNNNLRTVDRRG
jgi:hypothetical protein